MAKYRSNSEGIYIRHILEHNDEYKKILDNALMSFTNTLILVLFTPFTDNSETDIISSCKLEGRVIPDIAFNKNHIIKIIEEKNCSYELVENIKSKTFYNFENMFIIKHK